jgi:predicted chitinase
MTRYFDPVTNEPLVPSDEEPPNFFDPQTNDPIETYLIPRSGLFQIGLLGRARIETGATSPYEKFGRLNVTSNHFVASKKLGDALEESLQAAGGSDQVFYRAFDWLALNYNVDVHRDAALVHEDIIGPNRKILTFDAERLFSSKLHGLYNGRTYFSPLRLVRVDQIEPTARMTAQASVRVQIVRALLKYRIANRYLQIAVLAVCSTEGTLSPVNEIGYGATPNAHIRTVFGKLVDKLTDEELNDLKKDDVKFFDLVYGGRLGNVSPGDGYKYRGRGFNGITGKSQYQRYTRLTGIDLVANPDRLNELAIAAECLGAYFHDAFDQNRNGSKQKYGIVPEDVSDLDTAVKVAFSCNAGWESGWEKNSHYVNENAKQLINARLMLNRLI